MEDKKDRDERIIKTQAIKLASEVEELEKQIAPGIQMNHNETMLRDDV